jgi:predicted O-linked N-acetylglucosamine transferase (SPINDLY family)
MRLGIALIELGRAGEALAPLERAVAAVPDDVDARINLGRAQASIGQPDRARASFEAALRSAPQRPEPLHNLGVLAMQANDLEDAERRFRQALAIAPAFADARLNLGIVLQRCARYDEALSVLREALAYDSNDTMTLLELGRTLSLQGKPATARDQYLRALSIAPESSAAHEGLASTCLDLGRLHEAIEHLRLALRFDPVNAPVAGALASALFQAGELDAASVAAKQCLELDAEHAGAYGTLANVHAARNDLTQALEALEAGYAATRSTPLLGMLAYLLRQACDWERWQHVWQEMEPLLGDDAPLGSPFWLLCEPANPGQLLTYTRRWAAGRFGPHIAEAASDTEGEPIEGRRLRIGSLSSDLHEHAPAYLIADVIERHDRSRFEVFAYSHGPEDASAMRSRMRAAFEHFVDIAQVPDDIAAERIRCDRLDLLIDLKGYTLGDRLGIMARRPCRTQASWLGYPGTAAVDFIDYLIADPVVIPDSMAGAYTERVVRMPTCYQPNDRARIVAQPLGRRDYGLPQDAWVLCCFNQTYKITPEVFSAWMRLLAEIPGSVLWLLESNSLAAGHLRHAATDRGIDPSRLVFAPRMANASHLARYCVADLALDTFPYTSHTTMSDALWCGCPAIALCGDTFAARVSSSIVTAAGLPDLIANNLDAYEALVLRLARDADYRHEVRARVAEARVSSPLFDSERFVRDLEKVYETLRARR